MMNKRKSPINIMVLLVAVIVGGFIAAFFVGSVEKVYAKTMEEKQIEPFSYNIQTFTVRFDSQGGTYIPNVQGVPFGATLTLPTPPVKDGYVFEGWYTDTSYYNQFTAYTMITGNTTVYAKWRKLIPVWISATPVNNSMTVGEVINASDISVWAHYDDGSMRQVTNFTVTPSSIYNIGDNYVYIVHEGISTNIKITGVPNRMFTVTFDSMGGSAVSSITNIARNTTIKLPSDPVKKDYEFKGWYTDPNGANIFKNTTKITSDLILYAYWEKIPVMEKPVYELNMDYAKMDLYEQLPLFIQFPRELKVRYESDDDDVASVDKEGIITANGPGYTTIYVILEEENEVFTCDIRVTGKTTNLKLNATSKTLRRGSSFTIKASVSPSSLSNRKLKYTSSNRKVATVSTTGKIIAKSRGICTISVSTTDGSRLTKKIKVNVK